MLVLVTNREDLTADRLVLELQRRGSDFVRFNTEDYPTAASLTWTPSGGVLAFGHHQLKRSEIDAVWWRRPLPPHMPRDLPETEACWAAGEALAAIEGFWRTLDARWVNCPLANAAAENKIEQLARAASAGFDIPPTVVTNDAETARTFLADHRSTVCKPLRAATVPLGEVDDGAAKAAEDMAEHRNKGLFCTALITATDAGDMPDFGPEPYLFQALVPKRYDLRVTVIGDTAWACRIESQSVPKARVDWRLGPIHKIPHAVEELPPSMMRLCLELTHGYGLRYAAIDLARRPDGGYTFFELNPNGQWAWVEYLTGLPLSARLADELVGPTT